MVRWVRDHPLLRGVITRIALSVLVLFALTVLVFSMIHLAKGDPVSALTGGHQVTPQVRATLVKKYGLDRSEPDQYLTWVTRVVRGDLGTSISLSQPVGQVLADRAIVTTELVGGALLIILLAGTPLGLYGALRPRSWTARGLRTLALATLSTPAFLSAYLLVLVFTVKLTLFPSFGSGAGASGRLNSLVLPWIALSIGLIGQTAEVARASFSDVLSSDYVEFARAKGVDDVHVIARHALPNVLPNLLTITGLQVGALLAGVVVVEQIFGLGGLGQGLIGGILNSDYPLIQGTILAFGVVFLIVNLLVDLASVTLDPRARTRTSHA